MEEKIRSFTTRTVQLRALLIFKDQNYGITSIKTLTLKCVDGTFMTHYPDHYVHKGKTFFLMKIDREKNAIIFAEKGIQKGELPRNLF